MPELGDGSVQTCVTSPPYFGLRDYGVEGQIGLEPTLEQYVARLVGVMREVRRVLRDDGTLWLNLGDSYASAFACARRSIMGNGSPDADTKRPNGLAADLKEKDLIGVPWAVAFALRADGWWLRSDIVWHKVPCMPESIEDRPTRSHEFIFLLSKMARYYYDVEAIREDAKNGVNEMPSKHESNTGPRVGYVQRKPEYEEIKGANRRDVWRIAPAMYAEAHFATFPPEIPSLCIRAGSKPGDLVLDPFAGSGTTLEVAEGLGRAWVGYELNEGYRPLIEARLTQRSLWSTHE